VLRRRAAVAEADDDARIARQMSWRSSFLVGAAQALALIPGFSRSGAAMGGGLLTGLNNEDAARFAFLLATPVIGAAALLKLPELLGSQGDGVRGQALVAAVCAGLARRQVPDAVLRDEHPDAVRRLLLRGRSRLYRVFRRLTIW
jgi:undecaprenyl-diphosphatase